MYGARILCVHDIRVWKIEETRNVDGRSCGYIEYSGPDYLKQSGVA